MSTTYDIKQEFFAIRELLEDDEINEETGEVIDNTEAVQALLSELEGKRDEKADNIAYLMQEAKDTELALKAEVTRLNERKAMFIKQQESLKNLLDFLLSGEKLKTDRFTFSYRTSQSVNITDESLVPAEFLNVKEVVTPDKKRIKEALANFDDVAGCEIVVKKSLGVR